MKICKKNIILFFALLILSGCNNSLIEKGENIDIFIDELMEQKSISYCDSIYIDSCRCVALETTDESLLGRVATLSLHKGEFYVFDSMIWRLHRFGSDGTYLGHYGRKGNGPGEYISLSGFYIDPYREEVALFDPAARKVHRFTLAGDYIGSVKGKADDVFPFLGKCEMIGPDEIVCQVHPNMKNTYSCVVLRRKDYSIVRVLSEHCAKNPKTQTVLSNASFSISSHHISCIEPFSDVVTVYSNDTVSEYIVHQALPEMSRKELIKRIKKEHYHGVWSSLLKEKNYSMGLSSIFESDRWAYIEFCYKKDLGSILLWDKSVSSGIVISGPSPSYFWDFRDIVASDGNIFIKILDGAALSSIPQEKLMQSPPDGWSDIARQYNPEDDNPVLVLYYMQD